MREGRGEAQKVAFFLADPFHNEADHPSCFREEGNDFLMVAIIETSENKPLFGGILVHCFKSYLCANLIYLRRYLGTDSSIG